jgi:MoxR-like ATPase
MINRITDPTAVELAMDEFDRLGREAFLEKYGFSRANRYFVKRGAKRYDSKAIYGVAHEIQFPEDGALRSGDFSGGHQTVQGPLEDLGYEFEVGPDDHGQLDGEPGTGATEITSEDLRLFRSSRAKQRYADLSEAELAAYARLSEALRSLGELTKASLTEPAKYEVRTTSGFHLKSGVRGGIPKDLWFAVSPRANSQDLAGMPQLFMIVSERGIEYGYGASVSPSDFSQPAPKQAVRNAVPIVFQHLPSPDSAEASEIERNIEASGGWFYRRKHRLPPNQPDFPKLRNWLRYLQSPDGIRNAAGTSSRYLQDTDVDKVNLADAVSEMARLFEPLLDRDWRTNSGPNPPASQIASDAAHREKSALAQSTEFADLLSAFLNAYGERRNGPFTVDSELGAAMKPLQSWLERVPSVASRPTISVRVSVGQGGWTKTPWIALLDSRETTTTQRGTYIVFLIAEDLSITYLTLNQGMTELRDRLGQRGAVVEMVRVAEQTRPLIPGLHDAGFKFDNDIDLRSDTGAARNYEIGTIAHVNLPSDDLPDDTMVHQHLEALLDAYDRVVAAKVPSTGDAELVTSPSQEEEVALPYSIDDALAELFLEHDDVARYLEVWHSKKNLILQGAPGVGKSFIARRLAYALIGFKDDRKIQTVQFHQSYSYEDFVQGYRPDGQQGFTRKNGSFYEFRDRALKDPSGTYVFVIDEINRGNLSKIFGELMLLIETDKRGPRWGTRLAYGTEYDEDFFVPENLFILGMMNTADRSLSLVDYALRRRFAFVSMEPLFGAHKYRAHLEKHGLSESVIIRIISRMSELNQEIESDRLNLGPGFRIGHSFFAPARQVADEEVWYRRIVETEIYPLLEEYWFDAPEKADKWRDRLLG